VRSYIEGIGDVTATDRDALREKWESNTTDDEDGDPYALTFADNDEENSFEAIYKKLIANHPLTGIQMANDSLYTMKPKGPRLDAHGMPIGVAPRLAKVRLVKDLLRRLLIVSLRNLVSLLISALTT
jgi:hypothetical protein